MFGEVFLWGFYYLANIYNYAKEELFGDVIIKYPSKGVIGSESRHIDDKGLYQVFISGKLIVTFMDGTEMECGGE